MKQIYYYNVVIVNEVICHCLMLILKMNCHKVTDFSSLCQTSLFLPCFQTNTHDTWVLCFTNILILGRVSLIVLCRAVLL